MIKFILYRVFLLFGFNVKKKTFSDKYVQKSFSQCGEDLLVDYIFKLRGIEFPTYIDVGCNHPYFLSNTAVFYERGCKGVNIDANPLLMKIFNTNRRNDINLNFGIGDKKDRLDFYIMEDDTLSTFSKVEFESMIKTGKKLLEIKKIEMITLNEVITKYCNGIFPDFLSIDVEGLDLEILKTINFDNNSPKIICVEAAEYSPIGAGARRTELIDFLCSKGYFEYANTNLNAIMVKKDFWTI